MIKKASKYIKTKGKNAVTTAKIIQMSRTAVESTFKYSAMPPHTPRSLRSVLER